MFTDIGQDNSWFWCNSGIYCENGSWCFNSSFVDTLTKTDLVLYDESSVLYDSPIFLYDGVIINDFEDQENTNSTFTDLTE